MTKLEFLFALRQALQPLSKEEREEHLNFYSEMIEDRVEEGLSEEAAVAQLGAVEQIAGQILKDRFAPMHQKKKKGGWKAVLLLLGAPLWLVLLIAAAAVALALYIVLWAVLIALWAVAVSLFACAVGLLIAGVYLTATKNAVAGIGVLGGSLVCAGLGIFMSLACKWLTKGSVLLTKKLARSARRRWHHG